MICSCASREMPLRSMPARKFDFDIAHTLFAALETKGAPQFLGFTAAEARGNHGHAQQLLLEKRHPERALQHRFKRGCG